ncbi:Uncharacterized conserved protein, contains DM10 domain [Plasmopara halstedii]|uniref:Uncharacterized conserved protein, contains DM10 domain n=1 Tax=Plasmopara halstedii TaxID=4781 RepID=A0A0P1B6G8_PLAHL|nr:Uncharacterized conserved protein, contains DM10 domain [Plasmopara halstedii]CEG49890.1 Uncharacterized conserved protein, contains DM10 domain [Plasmopara halstedii]|eukprot:XP_024586259.1 Uncharacterized conserved protein, contains DM10 domain [Plasmopara halstedii]
MSTTTTPKNLLLGASNYDPRLRSYLKPQRFKLVENSLRLDSTLNQMSPLMTRLDLREPERFETTASDFGKTVKEDCKFAPQNVRQVLRFQSFYIESVDESNLEVVRLRKNTILFYLHDETFEIIEPRVQNSGIPQGTFLKRCQLRHPGGELYSSSDLRIGFDLHVFGRCFKLYDCDEFTREYYARNGQDVGSPLSLPKDEYTITRDQITRMCGGDSEHFYGKQRYPLKTYMEASLGNPIRSRLQSEKKRKFLANNSKVLCFHCEYDARDQLDGELMSYTLNYFLEDDTMEFKEVMCSNNGRDPFPLLLRRARLLKNWHQHLTDEQDRGVEEPSRAENYYGEADLYVGAVLNVFGRSMRLVDADKYTRDYYEMAWGRVLEPAMPTKADNVAICKPEPAPYNGYGTEEDSLGSCYSLRPKAPRKDFKKMAEFDRMLLRFRARIISSRKEQQQRRFIVSYFLTDDTISVYEPELRNSGIVNGKFLERGAYKNREGVRYSLIHLVEGAELVLNSHRFQLLDSDEYTKKFLAS